MENISIETDMAAAIDVIRHAGIWMRDSDTANYSSWWNPEKVSNEMLSPHAKPNEFFVIKVGAQPVATAIIQTQQSLQDWSSIDNGKEPPKAIYVHYVAVEREFAGQGLVAVLVEKATAIAKQQGCSVIRLDTNANEPKLCSLYQGLGFHRVGTEQDGDHLTAFYEKPVLYSSAQVV